MDPEPKPSAKMDDRLARQLSDATAKNEPLQAWFRLHPEHASQPASAPAAAKALAEKIVGRVSKRVGQSAESVNIQPFLGTFTVKAHPVFLKELLHQPEIAVARATDIPEFALIKPVDSKPVTLQHSGARGASKRKHRGS